ncbi:MAG: methyltransferase domain-containing protein [Acidobacteria bacterium]|nr:methyltransferase domain-containing protein [Acidobacteriota bacterium]
MIADEAQKQQAIDTHSQQAAEFAASYDSLERDAYATCFNYSRRRLNIWLDRLLPERADGLRLLDVGCGTGHHLVRFRRLGFEVVGTDGSGAMLEQARSNNPGVEFYESDVEHLPFEDAGFDYLNCIEVLRYLPRMDRCVAEMGRVLKRGGVALVTAAPRWSLNGYFIINRLAPHLPVKDLVTLKQFFTTSGELKRVFAAAGFVNVEVHGVYFGPLNWVERLAPRMTPGFLKRWERFDEAVADRAVMRELSNMFLVRAEKS